MRGRVSYVTLMVLNPFIILLYQNCSVVPGVSYRAHASSPPAINSSRAPASIESSSQKSLTNSCQRLAPCPENLQ